MNFKLLVPATIYILDYINTYKSTLSFEIYITSIVSIFVLHFNPIFHLFLDEIRKRSLFQFLAVVFTRFINDCPLRVSPLQFHLEVVP